MKREFSAHVIVYMACSILSNLVYPFGYFGSTGLISAQLYPCTMKAIPVLTALGFYVMVLYVMVLLQIESSIKYF